MEGNTRKINGPTDLEKRSPPARRDHFQPSNLLCHELLMTNRCNNIAVCPHKHNPTLIQQERQRIIECSKKWEDLNKPIPRTAKGIPLPSGRPPVPKGALNHIEDTTYNEDHYENDGDEDYLDALDECGIISSIMNAGNCYWRASHREAEIVMEQGSESRKVNVITLFDTGASHSNFVSTMFVEKHHLQRRLVNINKKVKVANNVRVNIDKMLTMNVKFTVEGKQYSADLDFLVMDGLNMDMIIGLPSICNYFLDVLIHMMRGALKSGDLDEGELDLIRERVFSQERLQPWSSSLPAVQTDEDNEIEKSSSNDPTQVMGENLEDARREFLTQLRSRVSDGFALHTNVLQFLSTEGMSVYVPTEWKGINIEPIHLEFKDGPPDRIKPPHRSIPKKLFDVAKKEIERLLTYFYVPSTSHITSAISIADKATPPYVRICGDYRPINKKIKVFNYPIPDVLKELHKAQRHSIFVDLDVRNAFHNIPIDQATSEMLSVQTPFGQFQPRFLPEGVAPASGVLMAVMTEIFADFLDWLIVIWDNILICASDYDDAYDKLVKVIRRCREKNVFLKLSKSWFGFDFVEFFGYLCRSGSYKLSDARKQSVVDIPFPAGSNKVRKMQMFLGSAVYFKPFIFDYSTKTAPLSEMTTKDFSWRQETWQKDYVAIFESFKLDILNSFTLYHPDYDLSWFLYVDASDVAVAGVLIQLTGDGLQQVIAFVSKKLTATAKRWSTIEKEAYAMFFSVSKLRYYLYGKKFTLLTDHSNLLWMESSEVPKIARIRLYLQGYQFDLLHVAGKDNVFADWQSRMHNVDSDLNLQSREILQLVQDDTLMQRDSTDTIQRTIQSVHNARMGHHGVQRTWVLLNKYCAGHGIPMRAVDEFVKTCAYCQKVRKTMNERLVAPIRANVTEHPRHMCAYDLLYLEPDREDYRFLHVFKSIPGRMVDLYPSKSLSAEDLASAMFQYFVKYGVTEILITDPGSNINSETVKLLLSWFGVRLRVSLTNRHQSNNVERSHTEILRFLSTLVCTEGMKGCWSKPHIIGIVQFIMNSEVSKETNISPYEYTFGTNDAEYFRLPRTSDTDPVASSVFLDMLNKDLQMVRESAKEVQQIEQRKRMKDSPLNTYVVGDYILFDESSRGARSKLKTRFSGPYVITAIHKADVTCSHIVTGRQKIFHMDDIKMFIGSSREAYDAAKSDDDQYVITSIIDYRGEPLTRTTMEFYVEFEGSEKLWLPYNADLASSSPFQSYCYACPELEPLTMTVKEWDVCRREYNRVGVKGVAPGDICYVNLKAWNSLYYQSIGLPLGVTHVILCEYKKWTTQKKKKIDLYCPLFRDKFDWDAAAVRLYGTAKDLVEGMVLVDLALCEKYPKVLA